MTNYRINDLKARLAVAAVGGAVALVATAVFFGPIFSGIHYTSKREERKPESEDARLSAVIPIEEGMGAEE